MRDSWDQGNSGMLGEWFGSWQSSFLAPYLLQGVYETGQAYTLLPRSACSTIASHRVLVTQSVERTINGSVAATHPGSTVKSSASSAAFDPIAYGNANVLTITSNRAPAFSHPLAHWSCNATVFAGVGFRRHRHRLVNPRASHLVKQPTAAAAKNRIIRSDHMPCCWPGTRPAGRRTRSQQAFHSVARARAVALAKPLLDVEGADLWLGPDQMMHALDQHGIESRGGQRSLTGLDSELIPHVWRAPEAVVAGTKPRSIELQKQILGRQTMIGYQMFPGQCRLFVNTMWVKESGQ